MKGRRRTTQRQDRQVALAIFALAGFLLLSTVLCCCVVPWIFGVAP